MKEDSGSARLRRPWALVAACALAAAVALPGTGAPAQTPPEYALPDPAAAPLPPLEPQPALRRAAVLDDVRGRVTYRRPGERRHRRLDGATSVPMRAIVDASRGRVRLTVERDRSGRTSSGVFRGGRFRLSQGRGSRPLTHLRIVGALRGCRTATAAKARKRRRLWGNAHGRFRTRGRYSAATVRGTRWLVEDRCDGTLTRVTRGEVEVIDYTVPPQASPEPQGGGGGGGVEGQPAPAMGPGGHTRPRRVRVRRGGTYVASAR